MRTLVLLFFLINKAFSDIPADDHKVKSLPGWDGELPSKQYSGYLKIPNATPNRYYHYWLVLSENDPTNDPIVFWFNGGPGASSLLGYFVEMGPFNVNNNSITYNKTNVPLLYANPWSWSKVSNIVYLESPAGVGYSYCDGDDGPINSCPNWNDTNVAEDNHKILQEFFKSYKEFMQNPFFIFGESYGGVYVPTLVMQIEKDPSGMPPLIGFGIGDGCMGLGNMGACGVNSASLFWQFMYGHAQMSHMEYTNLLNICGNSLIYGNETAQCRTAMNKAQVNLGGYNIYALYDKCYLENDEVFKYDSSRFNLKHAFNGAQYRSTEGNDEYNCGGWTVTGIYLNQDEVKTAVHVPLNITWQWQDGNWDKYNVTQTDLTPYYVDWVKKYRIIIYFGDTDAGVPYQGGEQWTMGLGYKIKEAWRPWTPSQSTMGGYVQIYETGTNFTYLTVRGAGHMVPQYRPLQALSMYDIFLHNEMYPPYTGPS